jgi:hypothetical protein
MKLIQIIKERKLLKIDKRIAWLTAKLEYWSTRTQINGTLPERICDEISDWKGEIAALTVEKKHYERNI